jgi:aerobic carbon-monoxide dehydrogenase medium subunit
MKPGIFVYHAPQTVQEALTLLAEVAPLDGRVLAGGQSLVPAMALRLAMPSHLVDINNIADLRELREESGVLSIGACVRHAAFHQEVATGPLGPLLSEVVRHIAHYPIRTRGTFCGSVANADPASEWALVCAVLGAQMVARSAKASRKIPAAAFFKGLMTTALESDEILVAVELPLLSADTHCGFYEFNRRAGDFAMAMSVASYRLKKGVIVGAQVGVGGVESHPRRLAKVEAALEGRAPSHEVFSAAADIAVQEMDPIDGDAAVADYKRGLAGTAVRRALEAVQKKS